MRDNLLNRYFALFNREMRQRNLSAFFLQSPDYGEGKFSTLYEIEESKSASKKIHLQLNCLYEMTGVGEVVRPSVRAAIVPARFRESYLPKVFHPEIVQVGIQVTTPPTLVYRVALNGKGDEFEMDKEICSAAAQYESELDKISAFEDFSGAIKLAFRIFDDKRITQ